jgi:Domain of unknown function (DUF4062)
MDNVELVEGHRGWVSNLHRALEVRVGQLLGKQPHIWRDPKLQGNDFFEDTLMERLQHVAALVPIISPRYVKSEWTRKELDEFWKAAREQGGVRFADKVRIFKVLKTPVPLEMHPPELQPLLGYEFFKVDPETGRVRELDEIFGPEAQRDFWLKLDDLAHDICSLLEVVQKNEGGGPGTADSQRAPVFLAETTSDLIEQRETIRRDLQQRGYTILPARSMAPVASELKNSFREDLARCQMSIHLIGRNYGLVPEGSVESLPEMQNELAIERHARGEFSRLLWIPPGLQVDDDRQRRVIDRFRTDPRTLNGADLLETFLEDLKTVIHDRLKRAERSQQHTQTSTGDNENLRRVYLICDQRDFEHTSVWADFLFEQRVEVIRPVFDGDEAEIRDYHEENLRTCDGALIFYGSANECWLRRKLRELQKSAGYGRSKPAPALGIALIAPRTAEKERFRTHEALVIPQFEGFSPEPLRPFVSRLQA